MSNKNKTQKINAAFDKALGKLNELRGGVRAYILLAVKDQPAQDGKENCFNGINAVAGQKGDLINLYKNIDPEISAAASMAGLLELFDKIIK